MCHDLSMQNVQRERFAPLLSEPASDGLAKGFFGPFHNLSVAWLWLFSGLHTVL